MPLHITVPLPPFGEECLFVIVLLVPLFSALYARPCLYGLGYPRQPSPLVTLGELIFYLFLCKVQRTVYLRITNSSRGGETTRHPSCLTSAGMVTLAGGTTFSHVNTLSCLPGTPFLRATCHVTSGFWFKND